ncbi:hypothetical protein LIER_43001 [Lithospermum erythrorhizon]|uniref:PIK helical domain-containing protein n=1 Tax=Lithospermum erythrorhizon TaxID=34254 RepID=A0AAV3P9X9_LITER
MGIADRLFCKNAPVIIVMPQLAVALCTLVRAYAVTILERAGDEELQCYLLQLVQALRFEHSVKSRLSHFLCYNWILFIFSI